MGVFNQDAAARKRATPFFHSGSESYGNSKRGGKLGLVEQSRGVVRQVAEFFFFFLGHLCEWLKVDDIRGDGRAGDAVAFDVFGVGRCWDVVAAKGSGSPVGLEVTGFSVYPGPAADDAGS